MSNNSSTKYYQNNKERPQKLVKNIKVYLKKKKEKKWQYGREWYKNLPEIEKKACRV